MAKHLLPSNSTKEEIALSLAIAPDITPEAIKEAWNPKTCPSELLPWLAWAFHVDYWEESLPILVKRRLIAESWNYHRHKGTLFAIRRSLADLGFNVVVREWPELRTPPHTFEVGISPIDSDQMRNAERCIREYKPERSHLISLIGKLPLLEQVEHVEQVISQHRHLLGEYYPWPELYYGSPGLVYSGALEYGGPYKYGLDISYGEYPDGVQWYGIYEKSESLAPALSHAIREAVFAEYLYGDTGLLYDSSKKYSMDATTTDTAKVDVYNILREKLELPSEGTNAAPRTVISESIDTGEGHKSNIVHHLAELAPQTETSAINIKRQAYYDGTVKYGENYYGQEVCYAWIYMKAKR